MIAPTLKPDNANLGEWNAYTEQGKDKQERNKRLKQAPERLRKDIRIHVTTVFKLRKL